MPGSSLWLLPPRTHPLNEILTSLIRTTTAHFNSPHTFLPHVTLSSEISPSVYKQRPQEWLDQVLLPSGKDISIKFEKLQTESVFFRKLTIKVEKNTGVQELGKTARTNVTRYSEVDVAENWALEEYEPHLSLLYSDISLSERQMRDIRSVIQQGGVSLEGEGEFGGWVGGRVVLVPTDHEIKRWMPIAEREL